MFHLDAGMLPLCTGDSIYYYLLEMGDEEITDFENARTDEMPREYAVETNILTSPNFS